MAADNREEPGQEGFITDLLRDVTITGTGDDPAPPPEEPQGAGFPRRGDVDDDVDEEMGTEDAKVDPDPDPDAGDRR